jgi:DNA-binding NtrC family response regulator
MRILIIDDEQLDLFITKKLLALEFEAEGFTTKEDAVQWATHNSFEVVLIDYYLGPDIHAHDVLKELVSLKGNTFKAYVLTNYVDENQIQELRKAGFADIIEKPFTLEKFKSYPIF